VFYPKEVSRVEARARTGSQGAVPSGGPGTDTSRGFELTSAEAAYVIERLNDGFGP